MSEQQPPGSSVSEAALRRLALRQVQSEVREQVRAEAWTTMRGQFRIAVAGLTLVTLVVGVLLGYYAGGERDTARGSVLNAVPVWGCVTLSPDLESAARTAQPTPWPIRVYVSGAVPEARVVALPPGSLIADALEEVGGAASDADLTSLNLAEPLRDHQHLLVPRLSSRAAPVSPATTPGHVETPAVAKIVNINVAPLDVLETLPGIGPARAQDIVTYREAYGPFEMVEALMNVPGIGPATYDKLAPFITVGAEVPGAP